MVVSVARDQGAGQDSPRGLYVILIMLPGKIHAANVPHLTTYRSLWTWTDLDKKVKIGMNITMQF